MKRKDEKKDCYFFINVASENSRRIICTIAAAKNCAWCNKKICRGGMRKKNFKKGFPRVSTGERLC
jgi:hypothetical protein